jgi:hypothetical protein
MAILGLSFLIVAAPFLLYFVGGSAAGIALGIKYWHLRLGRQPLPRWTDRLRLGWHLVFGAISVSASLPWMWLRLLCGLSLLVSFGVFLIAWRMYGAEARARALTSSLLP